jgi:hypothetical protein
MHGHWISHKLGIHEDVDAGLFSPQHWIEYVDRFLESFAYFQPSGDEDIIVLSDFFSDAIKDELLPKKERMMLDVEQLMREICQNNTFYRTKVRKLLPLVREIRKNSSVNLPNILALSENSIMMPVEGEEVIAFDTHRLIDKLVKPDVNSVFDPVHRILSQIDSHYLNKWFPNFDTSYLVQTMNKLRYSGFRMVDF